jgi:hypothetical protein
MKLPISKALHRRLMDYRPFRIASILFVAALFFGCIQSLFDVISPNADLIATSDPPPVFIKKDLWHLWDPSRDGVLFRDELKDTISCDWVDFRPAVLPDIPPPIMKSTKMCVYGERSNDVFVSTATNYIWRLEQTLVHAFFKYL